MTVGIFCVYGSFEEIFVLALSNSSVCGMFATGKWVKFVKIGAIFLRETKKSVYRRGKKLKFMGWIISFASLVFQVL